MKAAAAEIDPLGALLSRNIHSDQGALRRNGRQPLVPINEWKLGQLFHIADKSAGGLHPRTFAAIHIHRQPNDDCADIVSTQSLQQILCVMGEFAAPQHGTGIGEGESAIGNGDADRFCTEVKAGYRLAIRDVLFELFNCQYRQFDRFRTFMDRFIVTYRQ